jgi:hypothetical protein
LDDSDVDDFEALAVLADDWKEVENLLYRLNTIPAGCKGL